MPSFSQASQDKLATCVQPLQDLFSEVIKHIDCTILCGHRGQAEQDEAYRTGRSKLEWPNGKHNRSPSEAVDVAPYPVNWTNLQRFCVFAGFALGIAAMKGVNIRWGGDWNKNYDTGDERFIDMPHFEVTT